MLFGDPENVLFGDGGDGFLVGEQELPRIAVVIVTEESGQGLRRAVEVEDEGVEYLLLGVVELLIGDRLGADPVDLLLNRLQGQNRGFRFCRTRDTEQAGVQITRSPARADAIGEAHFGAYLAEQARIEAAAQDVGQHFEGWIVLVA